MASETRQETTVTVYEIINPSDPYTMASNDFAAVAAATLLLGSGKMGARPVEGEGREVPLMLFWKENDVEQWCQRECGMPLAALLARHDVIADALDSVIIGSVQDRATYEDGLALITDAANRDAWRERWLDQRRSSMNNIGGYAHSLATQLRSAREGREPTEDRAHD